MVNELEGKDKHTLKLTYSSPRTGVLLDKESLGNCSSRIGGTPKIIYSKSRSGKATFVHFKGRNTILWYQALERSLIRLLHRSVIPLPSLEVTILAIYKGDGISRYELWIDY